MTRNEESLQSLFSEYTVIKSAKKYVIAYNNHGDTGYVGPGITEGDVGKNVEKAMQFDTYNEAEEEMKLLEPEWCPLHIEEIEVPVQSSRRPIKSGYDNLFNQIKKYIEDETVGMGVVETNGNTITYRSLTVKVYNDGYDMSDDTVHIYHSEGNTFEEFVDDYWEWVNPF